MLVLVLSDHPQGVDFLFVGLGLVNLVCKLLDRHYVFFWFEELASSVVIVSWEEFYC